jgi:hypothetical protein
MDLKKLKLAIEQAEKVCNEMNKCANKFILQDSINMLNEAITVTRCCTLLVCVDDNDLPNLTKEKEYEMLAETNRHYNIIDDNENDVLISKKYFVKVVKELVVKSEQVCDCKKHSIKTNYGFEICTKCNNEFDD